MAAKDLFTAKEINIFLNNALLAARQPRSLEIPIPEARLRKLRNYLTALLQPIETELQDELLRPEEVVFMLLAGAAYYQKRLLPTSHLASEEILEVIPKLVRTRRVQ